MRDSRRARLTLTILLLVAFTLITLDYRSGALGGVRRVASDVFGPIESAAGSVTHPVGSFFSSLGHVSSYKHDNDELKKQITALQEQLHLTDQQRSELSQLEKIDHLAGTAQFTVVPATVVAYGSAEGFEWTVTINRGSADRVSTNEAVIDGDGLVGRVVSVGRDNATVLLANDPTSLVGVRLEGSEELGTVQGGGRGAMTLQLYNPTAALAVGDRLVTAGSRNMQPYVPEVPVGHIVHVSPANGSLARTAEVVPYVDYTAIDEVAVVVAAPPTVKKDSLLPPKPQVTPTPTVTVTKTVTATPRSTP